MVAISQVQQILICMELTRDRANEFTFCTHFEAHKHSVRNALTKCILEKTKTVREERVWNTHKLIETVQEFFFSRICLHGCVYARVGYVPLILLINFLLFDYLFTTWQKFQCELLPFFSHPESVVFWKWHRII